MNEEMKEAVEIDAKVINEIKPKVRFSKTKDFIERNSKKIAAVAAVIVAGLVGYGVGKYRQDEDLGDCTEVDDKEFETSDENETESETF